MAAQQESLFIEEPHTGRKVHIEKASRGEPPRGWVLILHGLGDHAGRHGWIKDRFLDRGYGVVGIDWPGCGQSGGVLGDLPTIDEAQDIIEIAVETAGANLVGVFCHSTGGFYLLRLLGRSLMGFESLKWVWFSSPLIRPDANHGSIKIAMVHFLARLFPHLTVSTHVRRDLLYHTAPNEETRKLHPTCHSRISLRFGSHLISAAGNEEELAASIPSHLRILFTQGMSDQVCPPQFAERLYHALPTPERTFVAISGARHEPFREPEQLSFLSAAELWLDQQT